MCIKLPLENLNHGPCPPQPMSTYTCEVIIASRIYGSEFKIDTKIIIVNHLFQLFRYNGSLIRTCNFLWIKLRRNKSSGIQEERDREKEEKMREGLPLHLCFTSFIGNLPTSNTFPQ